MCSQSMPRRSGNRGSRYDRTKQEQVPPPTIFYGGNNPGYSSLATPNGFYYPTTNGPLLNGFVPSPYESSSLGLPYPTYVQQRPNPNPNPNPTIGSGTTTGRQQERHAPPPPPPARPSFPYSPPVGVWPKAPAPGMGGGNMRPGILCIDKAFDPSHVCNENCPRFGDVYHVGEPGDYDIDIDIDDDEPYYECQVYCNEGCVESGVAQERPDGDEGSSGQTNQGLQAQAAGSTAVTNAEPQLSEAAATCEGGSAVDTELSLLLKTTAPELTATSDAEHMPSIEEETLLGISGEAAVEGGSSQTVESISVSIMFTDFDPESLIEEETSMGDCGQCIVLTLPAEATKTARPSTRSGPESSPTVAAKAENTETPADASVKNTTKAAPEGCSQSDDDLETSLEEEARQQRLAREKRQKNRSHHRHQEPEAESPVEDHVYTLARQLAELDEWGFLSPHYTEEDDETLLPYGDRFGLAVLSEHPEFFTNIPQRPHYKLLSPPPSGQEGEETVAAAEQLWELYMPLVRRGVRAAKLDDAKGMADAELVAARLEASGFDLRHLKAYIVAARKMRAALRSTEDELKAVAVAIDREARKVERVASSSGSLREAVAELEADKARYQALIEGIESSLAEKAELLEVEEVIRQTGSTPALDQLRRSQKQLDDTFATVHDDFESLGLLFDRSRKSR